MVAPDTVRELAQVSWVEWSELVLTSPTSADNAVVKGDSHPFPSSCWELEGDWHPNLSPERWDYWAKVREPAEL